MKRLADSVADANLADRIFNERQLGRVVGGSVGRRYALVNRAIKDGTLIRVKRGTYLLDHRHRSEKAHPFAVAQALWPGSYISLETALSFHGWIPEAVFVTASISPGRKSMKQEVPQLGMFTCHPLALHNYQFLTRVERVKLGKLTAFVASPLRALMDLVALRKERWSGFEWLTTGLRIEETDLLTLEKADFELIRPVYKHAAVVTFLNSLESEILSRKAQLGRD